MKTGRESNDDYRKRLGHLFKDSYCQLCGCGISFAPTELDPDFQVCPQVRPDTEWTDETPPGSQ